MLSFLEQIAFFRKKVKLFNGDAPLEILSTYSS